MPNSDRYRLGPFIFDQSTGKIWQGQKEDRPTPSERLILKLLIDNPEGLLPDNLKKAVLESTRVNLSKSAITTHVGNLRRKIPGQIRGARGGEPYRLESVVPVATAKGLNAASRSATRLWQDIGRLHISPEIQDSIHSVVSHPEYPQWMSISGHLVKNPVWQGISAKVRRQASEIYRLDASTVPEVMHLDVFLIRSNDHKGIGQLYTYPSQDWKTRLIPFHHRLPEENPTRRDQLNRAHLAQYLPFSSDSLEVHSLPDKYAVSAKLHAKYGDLIIYIFEFCSVSFRTPPPHFSRAKEGNEADQPWYYLDTLRNDKASWSVNGDVIRSLHELFSVTLGPLPCSLPGRKRLGMKSSKRK
jgi:hypothetical protein